MRHAVSRDLHDGWSALRAGPAGAEGDLDPGAIRGVLASAFVLEAGSGGPHGATVLLSGTRVDALFGRPLRGEGFEGLWSGPSRPGVAAALGGLFEGGPPIVAAVRGGPPAEPEAAFELVLLPLGLGGSGRRRALGSLAALSTPGWIGVEPVAPLHLAASRALEEAPGARGPAGVPVRIGRFVVHPGGRDRRRSSPGFKFSRP